MRLFFFRCFFASTQSPHHARLDPQTANITIIIMIVIKAGQGLGLVVVPDRIIGRGSFGS